MKMLIAAIAVAGGLMAVSATEAAAVTCRAHSRTGAYGWGSHPYSVNYARRRALYECAIRTPRRYTCYITSCG